MNEIGCSSPTECVPAHGFGCGGEDDQESVSGQHKGGSELFKVIDKTNKRIKMDAKLPHY